jgi:hypothetical protein
VADERDRRPGCDVELELVENVGQRSVSEAHALEVDATVDLGQLVSIWGIDDVGLLAENVGDAVESRGCREECVVELRELLDGVEEVRQVQGEGEERADRERTIDDER